MLNIEEKIEKIVTEPIEKLGYEVYDVTYSKEGKENYLRIFIDNNKGISLEDCEKVNNGITDILDEADYIKEQYFLEVSSPGIERILRKDKHFKDNIGKEIYIKTYNTIPYNKSKEIIGILKEFSTDNIVILIENTEVKLERKNIILIKKTYKW